MSSRLSRHARTAAACTAAVLLTACSSAGDDGSSGAPSAEGPFTIRILTLPIVDDGPIFYGIDHGFFEEHGLTVEIATTSGGAAGIPAMLGGSADMIYGSTLSGLQAAVRDLPVRIVAAAATSLDGEDDDADYVAIVGPPEGSTDASTLEGTTMAVNTLGNINELFTKAFLDDAGVDPGSVELVELPFPEQPAALLSGRLSATMIGAPFLQSLQEQDAVVLGYPYRVQDNPVVVGSYMTTETFADDNPEALQAFVAALEDIVADMARPENFQAVIDSLAEATQIDPAVLEQIVLPNYTPTADTASLEETIELAKRYGLLTADPDLDQILLPSAV